MQELIHEAEDQHVRLGSLAEAAGHVLVFPFSVVVSFIGISDKSVSVYAAKGVHIKLTELDREIHTRLRHESLT